MLGHLITYLRRSLPRAEESMSTLGEELERARAYLEILRIRMGERLRLEIQVPESLLGSPMPPISVRRAWSWTEIFSEGALFFPA